MGKCAVPVAALLSDGRLHLQHGPIDLLIDVDAAPVARRTAYAAAAARLDGLLEQLVDELPLLRSRVTDRVPVVNGPVARRMFDATWPHRRVFITPMAAVAGAVADEILAAMLRAADLQRASVNNGGDIALHLAPGRRFRVGVVGDVALPHLEARIDIDGADRIGGIATSGWRGRSQSLGIADAVTVLAATAAHADAATKPIAMAIDVPHPAVVRRPARELRADSDLGELPVVIDVGVLPAPLVSIALARGAAVARELCTRGLIRGAWLRLQAQSLAIAGSPSASPSVPGSAAAADFPVGRATPAATRSASPDYR